MGPEPTHERDEQTPSVAWSGRCLTIQPRLRRHQTVVRLRKDDPTQVCPGLCFQPGQHWEIEPGGLVLVQTSVDPQDGNAEPAKIRQRINSARSFGAHRRIDLVRSHGSRSIALVAERGVKVGLPLTDDRPREDHREGEDIAGSNRGTGNHPACLAPTEQPYVMGIDIWLPGEEVPSGHYVGSIAGDRVLAGEVAEIGPA